MKKIILVISIVLLTFITINLHAIQPAVQPLVIDGPKMDCPAFTIYNIPFAKDNLVILCPQKPLKGNPWVLAGSFYDMRNSAVLNMTRTELELVKQGFYVVAFGLGNTFGAPDAIAKWDLVYKEMTEKYGMSKRVALMGVSREGLPIARWASNNPGKVSCLYMDRAVCDFKSWPGGKFGFGKGSANDWKALITVYNFSSEEEAMAYKQNPIDLVPKLVADKVAILYVAGDQDNIVPYSENGERMKQEYEKLGGTFEVIISKGEGHWPHGLLDPTPVIDFIKKFEL